MTQSSSTTEHFRMINVGGKRATCRRALAQGSIYVGKEAFALIKEEQLPKGDVLALAEAAGVMAAKKTAEIIPLCHPLGLDVVSVWFELKEEESAVSAYCEARATAKTGVEMEALTGVTAALLSVYDLTKGVCPALTISNIRLRVKEGGKSGRWVHPELEDIVELEDGNMAEVRHSLKGVRAAVLTVSDRVSKGMAQDESGPLIESFLREHGAEVVSCAAVADEKQEIIKLLERFAATDMASLIVATGGTGLGPRDVTPEAVTEACDKLIPGIGEHILRRGMDFTPKACLSRAVAGLIKRTLVISLPGSPRGVAEGLIAVEEVLPHALSMVQGGGHD